MPLSVYETDLYDAVEEIAIMYGDAEVDLTDAPAYLAIPARLSILGSTVRWSREITLEWPTELITPNREHVNSRGVPLPKHVRQWGGVYVDDEDPDANPAASLRDTLDALGAEVYDADGVEVEVNLDALTKRLNSVIDMDKVRRVARHAWIYELWRLGEPVSGAGKDERWRLVATGNSLALLTRFHPIDDPSRTLGYECDWSPDLGDLRALGVPEEHAASLLAERDFDADDRPYHCRLAGSHDYRS